MKNNNWKLILIIIGILLIGGIFIFSSQKNNSTEEKMQIGVILPLTGPAASLTEDLQRTISLYEKEAKNIEFVLQDDQCSGKGALSAYNLLKNKGIKIYVAACSGSILALAPVVKEDGNVILTGFGGSIEIRKTGDEVIRFIPDGLSISKEMIDIIKQNPNKKYVLLHEKQDYSQSVGDFLMNEVGDQIISRITYTPDTSSYKTELSKMKALAYDEIIFIPVADPAAKILFKEMAELGITKNILGDVNMCDKLNQFSDFDINGQCLKTVLKSEGYNTYITDFKNQYGHEPTYPFYNAITYDVLHFIDSTLGENKKDKNIVQTIKKEALDGVQGLMTSYEFEPNGDVISKKEYLEVIQF